MPLLKPMNAKNVAMMQEFENRKKAKLQVFFENIDNDWLFKIRNDGIATAKNIRIECYYGGNVVLLPNKIPDLEQGKSYFLKSKLNCITYPNPNFNIIICYDDEYHKKNKYEYFS